LQTGDEVPGFSGSHVISFAGAASINSSGAIVFAVSYSLPGALPHEALMRYDGSAFHKIVSSDDSAPASAGNYGTSLVPIFSNAINDNGDVAFTAVPTGTGLSTLISQRYAARPLQPRISAVPSSAFISTSQFHRQINSGESCYGSISRPSVILGQNSMRQVRIIAKASGSLAVRRIVLCLRRHPCSTTPVCFHRANIDWIPDLHWHRRQLHRGGRNWNAGTHHTAGRLVN
jgi:hypothetical protein